MHLKLLLLTLLFLLTGGCATQMITRELTKVEEIKNLNPDREYLKVHMQNGDLYVLHSWTANEPERVIHGKGTHLDFNRRVVANYEQSGSLTGSTHRSATFSIPFDQIIIVETNQKGKNPGVAAMVITSIVTVPIAIACLVDPKACFGSCPTFYVRPDSSERLVAEGFSSSISRSLEETDVDVLDVKLDEGPIEITMKNEALETHMVNAVNLLVCEKQPENKVLQSSDGKFYEVSDLEAPTSALHSGHSIVKEVESKDQLEWFSLADSINLVRKEELYFEFRNPGGALGVVLTKRQSLMTTYLFYQMLALTGNATSHYITEMETRRPSLRNRINRMYDLLGGIEVFVRVGKNQWKYIETIREAGPIVSDMHLIRLPVMHSSTVQLRFRLTKGLWRINAVNLARVERESQSKRFYPERIENSRGVVTEALEKLLDSDRYLVTYPGEVYRITYPIVYRPTHQYFIESQGYYIEWMRDEWLKDQDLKAVRHSLLFPSSYLKRVAPMYKEREKIMEEIFWNSQYTKIEN